MEQIKYQGRIIEVIEKQVKIGDKEAIFEVARRSPGVRLIIPTENGILLTREYREELGGYDLRLPGGKVFDRLADYNIALSECVDIQSSAKIAAIKEAKEEAGIYSEDLEFFHRSVCGTTIDWDLYYFVINTHERGEQTLGAGEVEDISMQEFTLEEAKDLCLNGSMQEERSALVLLRYINEK